MSPICIKCGIMMSCSKNGAWVNDEPSGAGFPATYWACDLYSCEGCGQTIATGFSKQGIGPGERLPQGGGLFQAPAESHSFRYPGR